MLISIMLALCAAKQWSNGHSMERDEEKVEIQSSPENQLSKGPGYIARMLRYSAHILSNLNSKVSGK